MYDNWCHFRIYFAHITLKPNYLHMRRLAGFLNYLYPGFLCTINSFEKAKQKVGFACLINKNQLCALKSIYFRMLFIYIK